MNKVELKRVEQKRYQSGSLWRHPKGKVYILHPSGDNTHWMTTELSSGHLWSAHEIASEAVSGLEALEVGCVVTLTVE